MTRRISRNDYLTAIDTLTRHAGIVAADVVELFLDVDAMAVTYLIRDAAGDLTGDRGLRTVLVERAEPEDVTP